MLGEVITNILALVLGYVYPALECFKTIERKRGDSGKLLFWCQYWVIIAMLTAVEKFGDIFVSWVPLYGESKVAFIVYLWHPKTKGTNYIFNRVIRPFMAQHETDIEKRLQGMLTKSIDVLLFYIKHFTDKGQSIAFDILQQVITSKPEIVTKPPTLPASSPRAKPRSSSILKRLMRPIVKATPNAEDSNKLDSKKLELAIRAAGANLQQITTKRKIR